MDTPLLQTKLYIPPPRPELVPRPRLIERLVELVEEGCPVCERMAPRIAELMLEEKPLPPPPPQPEEPEETQPEETKPEKVVEAEQEPPPEPEPAEEPSTPPEAATPEAVEGQAPPETIAAEPAQEAVAEPYRLEQTLYRGGDIVTMAPGGPETAEAVVQREGRIVFVGSEAEALAQFEGKAEMVDLAGKTMLPGFIDAHGHRKGIGLQAVGSDLLPPPDSP